MTLIISYIRYYASISTRNSFNLKKSDLTILHCYVVHACESNIEYLCVYSCIFYTHFSFNL